MRKLFVCFAALLCTAYLGAQTTRDASQMVPTGKGWGEPQENAPRKVPSGTLAQYGISYHGGPVMLGNVNVYFIWYGNWTSGARPSDSQTTVTLLNQFFAPTGGIGGSGYERINTTYTDANGTPISGNVALAGSTSVGYSNGSRLKDSTIQQIVKNAISSGALRNDPNGVYFVLTSSDVAETSGFCTRYCGWHTHANILGSDIKYSFVGNPDRCPNACEWQTNSPNGDSGADGMANIMAHESEEAISDPDLNAWYDSSGQENADKCAWRFGPVQTTSTGAEYNQVFGNYKWLIQLNWDNEPNPGCTQTLGGTRYTF
jgi:hypothetical protein